MGALLFDEPAPQVARLTISNPGKRGALDLQILDEFVALVPTIRARCLIITGEAAMFSAGYDIRDLPPELDGQQAEQLISHPYTDALKAVEDFPFPTIAALNGHTLGGGLELAASCDLRYAAPEISLGMPPAKLGLIYSSAGLRKFMDLVGVARTKELFLTARRIDAPTAADWGLVNAIIPPLELSEFVVDLATEMAQQNAPLAQAGNKRMIDALSAAGGAVSAELEAELQELRRTAFGSRDFAEGVSAFREKRSPEWLGE